MNERKPDTTRGTISFVLVVVLGLVLGFLIKKVTLGLILGLILGFMGSTVLKRRK